MKKNIRELTFKDMNYQYFRLLDELTIYPNKIDIQSNWLKYTRTTDQYIFVTEHNGKIVGTAALLIEHKIRGGRVGHIEDVVVDKAYRGKGIGANLIDQLISSAKKVGCYKIILSCSNKNVDFYIKFGFKKFENSLKLLF